MPTLHTSFSFYVKLCWRTNEKYLPPFLQICRGRVWETGEVAWCPLFMKIAWKKRVFLSLGQNIESPGFHPEKKNSYWWLGELQTTACSYSYTLAFWGEGTSPPPNPPLDLPMLTIALWHEYVALAMYVWHMETGSWIVEWIVDVGTGHWIFFYAPRVFPPPPPPYPLDETLGLTKHDSIVFFTRWMQSIVGWSNVCVPFVHTVPHRQTDITMYNKWGGQAHTTIPPAEPDFAIPRPATSTTLTGIATIVGVLVLVVSLYIIYRRFQRA